MILAKPAKERTRQEPRETNAIGEEKKAKNLHPAIATKEARSGSPPQPRPGFETPRPRQHTTTLFAPVLCPGRCEVVQGPAAFPVSTGKLEIRSTQPRASPRIGPMHPAPPATSSIALTLALYSFLRHTGILAYCQQTRRNLYANPYSSMSTPSTRLMPVRRRPSRCSARLCARTASS